MLGEKQRTFKTHLAVSLEGLVPKDNFYRQLEAKLDLGFVRDLVRPYYSPCGRHSIDPVVFFKLQLIMFFEGIRSERQLMNMAALRLDHRWYLGYDLDEAVPHHSSLSKLRTRYGLVVFQQFFEQIVEVCRQAGLVWGGELHFDSTLVDANADYKQMVPRFYQEAQAHLQALFKTKAAPLGSSDRHFVHKYKGDRPVVKSNSYHRKVDYWVSPTDPDATGMGKGKLAYRTQYVVDGGQSRIILACLVTPSAIQDPTPMLDLAWWTRFRWQLPLRTAVADMRFGIGENLAGLESQRVTAFIPPFRQAAEKRTKRFPKSMFTFDPERNCYTCPQGQTLVHRSTYKGVMSYKAKPKICRACPVKAQCTTHKWGRMISHTIFKPWEDRVTAYLDTPAYKKAMRKRQVWIEPRFAEVKQWHHGRRFRLRGVLKVNIEALLKATGQNIKQLLKAKSHKNTPKPPANMAAFRLFSAPIPAIPQH